jgi:hypothetical protein
MRTNSRESNADSLRRPIDWRACMGAGRRRRPCSTSIAAECGLDA